MENQDMSSSSSSTTKSQKLKGIVVAMEESKEKTNRKQRPLQEVIYERRTRSPPFESDVVHREDIMRFYPSSSNKLYTCHFCKKGFSSSQALGGHQNAHKQERDWDRKRKEMEANFPGFGFLNPYLDKPHLLLGGYSQDALSNDNHLGITLDFIKPRCSGIYSSFNSGVTRGIIIPRVTPTSFFSEKPNIGGSSSRAPNPLPSYKKICPLIARNVPPFSPPQNTNFSSNVLTEKNFISRIGINNIVEIDDDSDDDQLENEKSKSWGTDLCLSL